MRLTAAVLLLATTVLLATMLHQAQVAAQPRGGRETDLGNALKWLLAADIDGDNQSEGDSLEVAPQSFGGGGAAFRDERNVCFHRCFGQRKLTALQCFGMCR